MRRRITVGTVVSTNVWRFVNSQDSADWVKTTYGRSLRTATVEGNVVEAAGRSLWIVEWQWDHPDPLKRRGQSPSSHLKIVRTEVEERRAARATVVGIFFVDP